MSDYKVFRHARVADPANPEVTWVAIARWNHEDGSTEWCVEYWEERGEAGPDRSFATEAEAEAHATKEFGLSPEAWKSGANRFGPAGDQPSAL